MSTWIYGPITSKVDTGLDYEDRDFEVQYQTTADILSIFRDGKFIAGFSYDDSRDVAGMMMEWYLSYVLDIDFESLPKELRENIESRRKRYKKRKINGTP